MKSLSVIALLAVLGPPTTVAVHATANPLAKVFDLINDLKARIVADGEKEDQAYRRFVSYCATTAKSVQYEIDTGSTKENQLTSKVNSLSADIEVGDSRIKDRAAAIAKAEAELSGATAMRKKEANEFTEGERELMSTIDTLERALSVLEKQVNSGKSFAQIDTSTLTSIVQTLSVVDDAAAMPGSNLDKLTALIQAQDGDYEDETGAPAEAAYSKKSGGIMDVIEDMKDKAEGQLSDLRRSETKAKNSYALLSQGLQDEIKAETQELEDEKSGSAEAGEDKASSEGNLQVTKKEVSSARTKNDEMSSSCQSSAADHEANVAARSQELKVIDEAEQILRDSTGAAAASFLQVKASSRSSQRVNARLDVSSALISTIRKLSKEHHSASLAQLTSRISAELKFAAAQHSTDPFKKVKDLIGSMIGKLEKEAGEQATEKAYCDEEMQKTASKKGELEDIVTQLEAKIGKSASKASAGKETVSELQMELSELTKEQAEMDKIRREAHAAYSSTKADLEQGLGGVRKAMSTLREFYGSSASEETGATEQSGALLQEDEDDDRDDMSSLMQQAERQPSPPQKAEKSTGAGGGIINLLEVVESDLAKNLATEDEEESDAQSTYDKQTQANKITQAEKEQDAKFTTQEFTSLEKTISESEADKATEVEELSAVSEYFAKLKQRCVAKPTSYEELKARREAEIQGLKDALGSLESEALMQVRTRPRTHGSLRGDSLRVDSDAA